MGGEVTLANALERIEKPNNTKDRADALADLKHILRHNQQSSRTLSDVSFHRIYEALFEVAVLEQSAHTKAKTHTLRSAAENRLSSCASALRLAVEVGLRSIKLKTVRAVFDHLIQTLRLSNGDFSEPLALDYAKCLRVLLSYQPHVEHLPRQEWERAATFCVECIQLAQEDSVGDDAGLGAEGASTLGLSILASYRSSRSQRIPRDRTASQSSRSLSRQIAEEMIISLRLLTSAPNAPVMSKASDLLWVVIEYLRSSISTSRSPEDAFGAINNILVWTVTEDIELTKKVTNHLLRLARHFWAIKSSALKDEVLVMIHRLTHYITHILKQETASALRNELTPLLEVMRTEYSKRPERDQLQLDDIRLGGATNGDDREGLIGNAMFALRSAGARAEQGWLIVLNQAFIHERLNKLTEQHESLDDPAEHDTNRRPSKRPRLLEEFDELIESTLKGTASDRRSAWKVLAFLAQQISLPPARLNKVLDRLSTSCSDEDGSISSWALLAASSLAPQTSSSNASLATRWAIIWQIALRSMSNASTCRAACFFLNVALRIRLVSPTMISEVQQILTTSIDLSGPSLITDSSLQLLHTALQLSMPTNPAHAAKIIESVVRWFTGKWLPSKFDAKAQAVQHWLFGMNDLVNFIMTCLQQQRHQAPINSYPTWGYVGQSIVRSRSNDQLICYLLLLPKTSVTAQADLWARQLSQSEAPAASPTKQGTEAVLITHIDNEIVRTYDTWSQMIRERPRSISMDLFASICSACLASLVIAHQSLTSKDDRRYAQLQRSTSKLLASIEDFAASSDCDNAKFDSLLKCCAQVFYRLSPSQDLSKIDCEPWEPPLAKMLAKVDDTRRQARILNGNSDEYDIMDTDESQFTQGSTPEDRTSEQVNLSNDYAGRYGVDGLRANVPLYATVIALQESNQARRNADYETSSKLVDHVLSLPDSTVVASCRVLKLLPLLGVQLRSTDAEQLLTHLMETVIQSVYEFQRSEVAIGTALEVMSSLRTLWTDPQTKSLFDLGLDMYDWCTTTALSAGALSPSVQNKFAALLLELCRVNTDYGGDSDVPSVRTSLFRLLQLGSITVQFYLGERIASIFGLFVLDTHDVMFGDLQESLPADQEWTEGIAIRIMILSNLGSSWPSLLRLCVYYIFETAGRIRTSSTYAASCVQHLAVELHFDSPQRLFAMFSSQLLHTWFEEGHKLERIPYTAFGFESLVELLKLQKAEIVAHIFVRGLDEEMDLVSGRLGCSIKNLIRSAFGKCLAYTISWDIAYPPKDDSLPSCEIRLRNIIGSKEEYKGLLAECFPMALGQFYVSAKMEDLEDRWLEKRDKYVATAQALAEAKSFSHSIRPLPAVQDPSFKTKYLPDQIERLCRRTSQGGSSPWTPSSFTLAVRMLLDSVDDALGPLHACMTVRKLRLLICMAGDVALTGHALELLLRSLLPFLSESQCADDTIGIMRYLLHHGRQHLLENVDFLAGTVMLLVLCMQRHIETKHDSMTQETQHRDTVNRMQDFKSWLIRLLQQFRDTVEPGFHEQYEELVTTLARIKLPGNAFKESPESTLLLQLLREARAVQPLLREQDIHAALEMLTCAFELPTEPSQDCLIEDTISVNYAPMLFDALQQSNLDTNFILWTAVVTGRAYAATGSRDIFKQKSKAEKLGPLSLGREGVMNSVAVIAHHISRKLISGKRAEASLADYTLRSIMHALEDPEEALAFEDLFPKHVVAAVADGTHGYCPPHARSVVIDTSRPAMTKVLQRDAAVSTSTWATESTILICQWQTSKPYMSVLPTLLLSIDDLAMSLFPAVVHIVLADETDHEPILRTELSAAMNECFSSEDQDLQARQQFFLKLLLYLKDQPFPGESTRLDRLRWLQCDYAAAANCAARCGMPGVALMLVELATSAPPANRRSSSRSSMSQQHKTNIGEDVLLAIFQQIDEPDSFYGVQQPASLESVLGRLDFEKAGFKGLMFRSAQLDSHLQSSNQLNHTDGIGMVRSLSMLNLNSLAFALASGGATDMNYASDELLDSARRLQQWDTHVQETQQSDSATLMRAFQELVHASSRQESVRKLHGLALKHITPGLQLDTMKAPPHSWLNVAGVLSEMIDITASGSEIELVSLCQNLSSRVTWMNLAPYKEFKDLLYSRSILFSTLSHNKTLLRGIHSSTRDMTLLEAQSLLSVSALARKHEQLQDALAAATRVSDLSDQCKVLGLCIESAAKQEIASVLWEAGETASSVNMLREILQKSALDKEAIVVGRSGLLARIGRQLADARLEKPAEILQDYLKPAIEQIKTATTQGEAGRVYHVFASFCDQQLQSAANLEDYARLAKLRQQKEEEVKELEAVLRGSKKSSSEKHDTERLLSRAKKWFRLDDDEFQKLKKSRDTFVRQSLQNYLMALQASDEFNISVLRFFALWLENADAQSANDVVATYLSMVPVWKFVMLMNQVMSRLKEDGSPFQKALKDLTFRICSEHPYHSLHHVYASTQRPRGKERVPDARIDAATSIRLQLQNQKIKGEFVKRFFQADSNFKKLAQSEEAKGMRSSKVALKDLSTSAKVARNVTELRLPPATISLALLPDGDYKDVPVVTKFEPAVLIMNGLSAPRVLTAVASDGKRYRQLFKSGNDDLRQDAIMEQVFEEVSKMLQNHKTTRQRNLHIRTYKVIPLTNNSGIIEFVPNSIPLNEFLQPAHIKYHPQDYRSSTAREKIQAVASHSTETRVKEYRKVCDHINPVMRHFFFERFDDPDEWFEKRTAYTRTTATVSMLGHVLGLGDRHCHNILLDEKSGEVVHIDLGVAFEAGRVLPIPELVPFRLTRDVVDGFGVTKTEGVFRRCCEFTMEALREDKDSIMTLLNVLRYDPLYTWTLSPVRAKRIQEAQEEGHGLSEVEGPVTSKNRDSEAGEAERALAIVEKKLSTTLSTAATVNELIQQATDERNLGTLFSGWAAYF